jgi:hypothetical protein
MTTEDRRRHIRAPFNAKVILLTDKDAEVRLAKNVSISGVFVESLKSYPIGTKLYVLFPVHHPEKTFKTYAKVVRVVELTENNDFVVPGMGIEFYNTSFDSSVLIEDYVVKIKNIYEEIHAVLGMKAMDTRRLKLLLGKAGISRYGDLFELKEQVRFACLSLGIQTKE